jgi:nucleoid-associated protein YgaU
LSWLILAFGECQNFEGWEQIMTRPAISSELDKALIIPCDSKGEFGKPIPVLFNPNKYSIDKSNQFAEVGIPGLGAPLIQFVRGNTKTLTMELFFDTYTYEGGTDVREYTGKITKLLEVDEELHAPPICIFSWGKLNFKCVIQQVSQNFTMFNADGVPVRATLNVTFKEYTEPSRAKKDKGLSSGGTKTITIEEGQRLDSISSAERGDPTYWRSIAEENEIRDPRHLEPGSKLLVSSEKAGY